MARAVDKPHLLASEHMVHLSVDTEEMCFFFVEMSSFSTKKHVRKLACPGIYNTIRGACR
jgi:hypothetical protein